MTGRDLDFMISAAPQGMMLFWREDQQESDPPRGIRRSEFLMYPNGGFLRFSDPENARKLGTILGECSRVSAYSPPAQVKHIMHPIAFRVPDGEQARPSCVPVTLLAAGIPAQSGETVRLAVTNRGAVVLKSYDLGYHLTQDEYKLLLCDEDSSCTSSVDEEETFSEQTVEDTSKYLFIANEPVLHSIDF
jgi:hypothetical protein